GFLREILGWLPFGVEGAQQLRAVVESLMFAGLVLCLSTFLELRKRIPSLGMTLNVIAASGAGLAAYGWYEPAIAAGLARIGFGFFTLFGFLFMLVMWRQGVPRARA